MYFSPDGETSLISKRPIFGFVKFNLISISSIGVVSSIEIVALVIDGFWNPPPSWICIGKILLFEKVFVAEFWSRCKFIPPSEAIYNWLSTVVKSWISTCPIEGLVQVAPPSIDSLTAIPPTHTRSGL